MCGNPLIVPEAAATVAAQADEPAPGTPWEHRGERGFLPAWWDTIHRALFDPGPLFRSARLQNSRDHLLFALLTGSVFWIVNQVVQLSMRGPTEELLRTMIERTGQDPGAFRQVLEMQRAMRGPGYIIGSIVLTPILVVLFLYANAGVTHLFAMLFGQSKRGFDATFTACAYAHAPLVLVAIPGCGWPIAVIWMVVLIGIGLKQTHGIGGGGATASVVAPYVVFCCLGCVASIFLGAMLRRMAGMGG